MVFFCFLTRETGSFVYLCDFEVRERKGERKRKNKKKKRNPYFWSRLSTSL